VSAILLVRASITPMTWSRASAAFGSISSSSNATGRIAQTRLAGAARRSRTILFSFVVPNAAEPPSARRTDVVRPGTSAVTPGGFATAGRIRSVRSDQGTKANEQAELVGA